MCELFYFGEDVTCTSIDLQIQFLFNRNITLVIFVVTESMSAVFTFSHCTYVRTRGGRTIFEI